MQTNDFRNSDNRNDSDVDRQILAAVKSIKFGSVEVTVHDGRVVQIDRRERTRVAGRPSSSEQTKR